MSSLAPQIKAVPGAPSSVRVGTITSLSPPSVSVQGTVFADVGFLGWYTPVVGDTVVVLGQSSGASSDPTSWLVLGSVYGSGTSAGLQAGSESVSVAAAALALLPVVFAVPYADPPAVMTNINSSAGATLNWGSRATAVTETGFTIYIFGPVNTFTTDVQWQAQPITQ